MKPINNDIVRTALEYMEEHYKNKVTLSLVAKEIYVSKWHLSKLIHAHLDQSFSEVLHGIRVEQAKHLLISSTMTIAQIGEEIGYLDYGHFTKSFRKITGMTPNQYRNEHRNEKS